MKSVLLVFLVSFSFSSYAQTYSFLSLCVGDALKVCKRDKVKAVPASALCEVPEDPDAQASDYDLDIVQVPEGFTGNLVDLIGTGTGRTWTTSEILAVDEDIVCVLNTVRKQARIDAVDASAQEKRDALTTLKAQCKSVADPFRNAVCKLLEAK